MFKNIIERFKKEQYPNKFSNQDYKKWMEASHELFVSEELTELSDKEVEESFGQIKPFYRNGLISNAGYGSKKLNAHTLNHYAKAISIYLKRYGFNSILVATNNRNKRVYFELIVSAFKKNNIEVHAFESEFVSMGMTSYALTRMNNVHGFYFSSIGENIEIKLLNTKGLEFDLSKYLEINDIIKNSTFAFEQKAVESINLKAKMIEQALVNDYYETIKITNDLALIKDVVVIVHSDATEHEAKKILANYPQIPIVRSDNKKSVANLDSPEAFASGYKFSQKTKANIMIAIDPKGTKLSIALKKDKTWKFLNSLEMGFLAYSLLEKAIVTYDAAIPNIFNNVGNPNSENRIRIGVNYKHSINKNEYYDSFEIFKLIFSKLKNTGLEILPFIKDFQIDHGFIYEEKTERNMSYDQVKDLINRLNRKKVLSDTIEIKSIHVTYEDKNIAILKAHTTRGTAIIISEKLISKLSCYYYNFSKNQEEIFYDRREIKKEFEKAIDNKKDNNIVESEKGRTRLLIFFGIFILALVLVFTFVFDWSTIAYSLTVTFTSWNTWEAWTLFTYLVIFPIIPTATYYFLMKNYRKDVSWWHIYKAVYLSMFINIIAPVFFLPLAVFFWYMRKLGYRTNEVIPAATLQLLIHGFTALVLGLFVLPMGFVWLRSLGQSSLIIWLFAFFGLLFINANTIFYYVLASSRWIQNRVFWVMEIFFFWTGRERYYQRIYDSMDFNLTKLRKNTRNVLDDYKTLSILVGLTLIGLFYRNLIFFASVNLVSETYVHNFFGLMGISHIAMYATGWLPIPGGVGVQDAMLLRLLTLTLGSSEVASQATFIYRFFTYYGLAFVTAVPFVWMTYNVKRKQQKQEVSQLWKN